jgi:para-aminobenzoate synthetase component I
MARSNSWKRTFLLSEHLTHEKILNWANQYDTVSCYLSNSQTDKYDLLIAVGEVKSIPFDENQDYFDNLKQNLKTRKDWYFGYFGYDLKNQTDRLLSQNMDNTNAPKAYFYIPKIVIYIRNNELTIESKHKSPDDIHSEISKWKINDKSYNISNKKIQNRTPKEDYLKDVANIRKHIIDGDVYELNYCQEYFIENTEIDKPLNLFFTLNALAQTPFAAYQKIDGVYTICASPERFFMKNSKNITSQPIKGTAKRGESKSEDDRIMQSLTNDEKNKAENIMIVDLVRNDFAKSCKTGSIKVEKLFEIKTFNLVHQMVSTVVGELKPSVHVIDAIRNAFPMGSMTGAPKHMAMQLIDTYEKTSRNIYSGAMGYFEPNTDCDFNVIIRTIIYNSKNKYLSYQVGGAIVYDSIPEEEYLETLVKAKGMVGVIG